MTRATLFSAQLIAIALVFTAVMDTSYAKGAAPFAPGEAPAPAAQTQDAATQQALRETQEALNDPAKRAAMLKGDPKAAAFDARVKSQLGGETDGAYQISASVMEKIVQETGGDPLKMQELVGKMMANPQLLEQYLSRSERQKISQMAGKMEADKGHAPASSGR